MRLTQHLICVVITLLCVGCSNIKPIFTESITLSEKQKAAFKLYQTKTEVKAFAVSPNDNYSSSISKTQNTNMLQFVLSNCQKKAAMPCQVLSLNNEDYAPKYTQFNQQSAMAIRNMQIKSENYRSIEKKNWWMESPERLRTLNEGIHFPTPMQLEGIKTIDTPSLVAAIKADNMLVIDAIGFFEGRAPTLPKAYAFDWIGIEYGNDSKEHRIDEIAQENLSIIMNQIAPDKTQAITVYCSSPECWLSVNAALRLKSLGYVNVHWYRGGLEAWANAGLPTVNFVPFATVWGRP